jgi:regulator of replication initiation timing
LSLKKTIEEKIKKVSETFDSFTAQLNEKKEAIEAIQKEMNAIIDEQKRLQGEYRTLKELLNQPETDEDGDIVV